MLLQKDKYTIALECSIHFPKMVLNMWNTLNPGKLEVGNKI